MTRPHSLCHIRLRVGRTGVFECSSHCCPLRACFSTFERDLSARPSSSQPTRSVHKLETASASAFRFSLPSWKSTHLSLRHALFQIRTSRYLQRRRASQRQADLLSSNLMEIIPAGGGKKQGSTSLSVLVESLKFTVFSFACESHKICFLVPCLPFEPWPGRIQNERLLNRTEGKKRGDSPAPRPLPVFFPPHSASDLGGVAMETSSSAFPSSALASLR